VAPINNDKSPTMMTAVDSFLRTSMIRQAAQTGKRPRASRNEGSLKVLLNSLRLNVRRSRGPMPERPKAAIQPMDDRNSNRLSTKKALMRFCPFIAITDESRLFIHSFGANPNKAEFDLNLGRGQNQLVR
jgi:hypothetical protein